MRVCVLYVCVLVKNPHRTVCRIYVCVCVCVSSICCTYMSDLYIFFPPVALFSWWLQIIVTFSWCGSRITYLFMHTYIYLTYLLFQAVAFFSWWQQILITYSLCGSHTTHIYIYIHMRMSYLSVWQRIICHSFLCTAAI